MQQLASTINGTTGIGVTASVVRSAPGAFRLVLTGKSSGIDSAFTIAATLSGGTGVSFTDTDGNGLSGDTDADNAVNASDAALLVNNVAVTGTSNTFDGVIPGVSFTVFRKDPATTVGIDISADSEALKGKVTEFIDAYNDFVKFANEQATAAAGGDQSSIGRDSLMRGLRNQLRSALTGIHGSGMFTRLAEVGVEFTQTGTLQLNQRLFNDAVANHPDDLKDLFAGTGDAFGAVVDVIDDYSEAGGLISSAKSRLTQQSSSLDTQIAQMQDRLAVQRAALQAEFTAADNAMKQLNSQSTALANFGSSFQVSSSSF
jgi:flagellar hook-associated protein 2